VGLAESARDQNLWPLNGLRHPVAGDACGWYIWAGTEFTRFAWYRTSELADLPLWMIHIAWPVAGVTWIVSMGTTVNQSERILMERNETALP